MVDYITNNIYIINILAIIINISTINIKYTDYYYRYITQLKFMPS